MLQDINLNKYIDAITNEAKQAREEAERSIGEYKAERLAKEKAASDAEFSEKIKKNNTIIREDIGTQYSAKEIEARSVLYSKREAIRKDVFDEAAKKLCEFANSPEYPEFLKNSVNSVKSKLFGLDRVVKVCIKQDDEKYKKLIEETMILPCEFEIDKSILIGGIKAKFAKLIINDTLDARLAGQKEWFEENSGLDIG